ncbi:MAG: hypothetical protein HY735_02510 [Verrucomicrobia bacterium]|nr:hypothetical protein [Verrucomicrobiota bacterium]
MRRLSVFRKPKQGGLAVSIQLNWGAHAPPRAVVGALADHTGAPTQVTVQYLNYTPDSTDEAPVETREGACAPQSEVHAYGLEKSVQLIRESMRIVRT